MASPHDTPTWQLTQRLMIFCPHTGSPIDTGRELTEVGRLAPRPHVLVDCPECGEDHGWTIEDAFLQ